MTFPPSRLLDRDAIWAAIDRERLDLADLLDDLDEQEWAHPTLCAGWRVRDVAAHLAWPRCRWARRPPPRCGRGATSTA